LEKILLLTPLVLGDDYPQSSNRNSQKIAVIEYVFGNFLQSETPKPARVNADCRDLANKLINARSMVLSISYVSSWSTAPNLIVWNIRNNDAISPYYCTITNLYTSSYDTSRTEVAVFSNNYLFQI
jgi:hypothetical protein